MRALVTCLFRIFTVACLATSAGCSNHDNAGDPDGDTDIDSDTDTDNDSDTDSDTDTDADTDSDTDSDGDTDSDTDLVWTQAADSSGWGERSNHGMASFDGKLWLIKGSDSYGEILDDVWSSSDGVKWTNQTTFGQPIVDSAVVSYNGYLWVLGGSDGY